MRRRTFITLLALSAPALAVAAPKADRERKSGGSTYVYVQALRGAMVKSTGRRRILSVECGIDVQGDLEFLKRVEASAPRLRSAFASTVQAYASNLQPDALPNTEFLVRTLQNDQSDQVRLEVVEALTAIGPQAKEAVPALTAVLNDRSRKLRTQAAVALGKIAPAG